MYSLEDHTGVRLFLSAVQVRTIKDLADVFDRYDVKKSIKLAERERRTKVTPHTKVFQVIEGRNIPDWKPEHV
jgi:cell division FtsZ-interacting protein ZapD